MNRILSMVLLWAWAIPCFAQSSDVDDKELIANIDQETLLRLSAQLQQENKQQAMLNQFRGLWEQGNTKGMNQLVEQMQSDPEGNQILQGLIEKAGASPELVEQLKAQVGNNRGPFNGGMDGFPGRPPAATPLPRNTRRPDERSLRPLQSREMRSLQGIDNPRDDPNQELEPFAPRRNSPNRSGSKPPDESLPNGLSPTSIKAKQYQAVTQFIEKTFGPLDKSPALQGLIRDIFLSEKLDADGGALGNLTGGKTGELFNDMSLDFGKIDFKIGGINFGSIDFSRLESPAQPSSGGWSSSRQNFFGGDSWWSVAIFMGVLVTALLLWWRWPALQGRTGRQTGPMPLPGQGPWPIDPREIHDRPTLVKAFDYIATSLYGDDAAMWNHQTIAERIRHGYADRRINSDQLGSIYAEARYRPVNEELADGAIHAARESLCKLAGVPA